MSSRPHTDPWNTISPTDGKLLCFTPNRQWWASILCLFISMGCGPDEVVEGTAPPRVETEPPPHQETRHDDYLYDQEGNLRESDERVAGLILPRGLELQREEERRHIYETGVPRAKLLGYFGPRLFTGSVDAIGDGAIYRAATVQGDASGVRLNVSIVRIGARTRVEVYEIPPMPEHPPSPAELRRLYDEQMRRAE